MFLTHSALLDDLDKESNTYAMRVKEWYGWHFPELVKVVGDNVLYAKCVKAMGTWNTLRDSYAVLSLTVL